jgi:hypothetical protein
MGFVSVCVCVQQTALRSRLTFPLTALNFSQQQPTGLSVCVCVKGGGLPRQARKGRESIWLYRCVCLCVCDDVYVCVLALVGFCPVSHHHLVMCAEGQVCLRAKLIPEVITTHNAHTSLYDYTTMCDCMCILTL